MRKSLLNLRFILPTLLLGTVIFTTTKIQAQLCYTLAWSDEFDGNTLDRSKWSVQIGDGYPDLTAWGNGESQYYTNRDENIEVSNGSLKIKAVADNFGNMTHSSARIRTQGIFDFKYGRIESRIKIPEGGGLWPAFWLLPTDQVYGGWPRSGEIDIMENFGQNSHMSSTIHYQTSGNYHQYNEQSYAVEHDQYHVFSAVWQEDRIDFYIDWNWIGSETPSDVNGTWPFNEYFHLILNLAVGGWAGDIEADFPAEMEVDYIRVYQETADIDIQGPTLVKENETVTYSLPENSTASYQWTVPSGATIVSGQGTAEVIVTWSDAAGSISCTVEDWTGDVSGVSPNCGDATHSLAVDVEASSCDMMLLDFEKAMTLHPHEADGIGGIETYYRQNPSATGINTSGFVGRYARSGAYNYDVLRLDFEEPVNIADIYNGDADLKIDFYKTTNADIPVTVEFVKRDENDNYPNGIHSQYTGTITSDNAWQTLTFSFINRPDWSLTDDEIDGINIFVNPDTYTSPIVHFDNIRTTTLIFNKEIEGDDAITLAGDDESYSYEVPGFDGANFDWTLDANMTSNDETTNPLITTFAALDEKYTASLSVDITSSMGCAFEYQKDIMVEHTPPLTTSLEALSSSSFQVSTLVENQLQITSSESSLVRYKIISLQGVTIAQGSFTETLTYPVGHWANGPYIIQLESNQEVVTTKFIKQ